MGKSAVAVIASLVTWFAIALGLGYLMRASWSEYAAVADAMTFTLPMMFARLSLGVLATLAAGWLAARFAQHKAAAPIVVGVLLLAFFIPQHIQLWDKFPVWYHLFFLGSLIPLAWLGGRIGRTAPSFAPLTNSAA